MQRQESGRPGPHGRPCRRASPWRSYVKWISRRMIVRRPCRCAGRVRKHASNTASAKPDAKNANQSLTVLQFCVMRLRPQRRSVRWATVWKSARAPSNDAISLLHLPLNCSCSGGDAVRAKYLATTPFRQHGKTNAKHLADTRLQQLTADSVREKYAGRALADLGLGMRVVDFKQLAGRDHKCVLLDLPCSRARCFQLVAALCNWPGSAS